MKKKILAALLATIMVFSFTACDKTEDDGVFVLSEDKLDDYIKEVLLSYSALSLWNV